MKRLVGILTVALCMVAMMLVMAASAFAAITEQPGNGNPDINNSGKCPGGQNKETSPGGLKKCP